MSETVQFGYFNLQGRGQIARLLLAYTKTQHKEKVYTFANIADWLGNDKVNLELDFPSLPYLIEGKLKLTESKAIEMYIIHRANKASELLGKNSKQKALINNIDGVLRDVFNALIGLFFASDFEAERKRIYPIIQAKLNILNKYIATRNYFLNRVTYVDFLLTVIFSYLELFFPHEFSQWENLLRLASNVNRLPEVLSYYASSEAISDVVAPQKANDPKFANIQPINQKQEKAQIKQQPQIEEPLTKVSQQNVKPQAKSTIKKTESTLYQVPVVTSVIQQSTDKNHFNTRIQQFQKAVEATNVVELSQVKVQTDKSSIVTPSKIGSTVRGNGNLEASWKIFSQNKQNIQSQAQKSSIILGYWGIRGLGQIQRLLLAYCGHRFTQKIYMTRQEWTNQNKQALALPFPNLPYLIEGDFRITESLAIDRYIIRTSDKHELLGKNLRDETLIENIVRILSEIFKEIRIFCFTTEDIEDKKAKLVSRIDTDFKRMNDFIENSQYAFGYLTWADFYIAEISYYIEKIFPQTYEKYHFLKNIQHAVSKVHDVQKYYEKETAVKGPFMPPTAKIFF